MSLYESLTRVLAPFAEKIKGIQTGYDGTTYSSPGEAVRTQISDLHVLIGDEPGTAIQGEAVSYDGTESGLTATTVQAAIDENAANVSNTNERLDNYEDIFTGDVGESVQNWLDEHPEATTTVQDGSLTYKKMVNGTLGFVTPEMFGAVGDGIADDTNALRETFSSGFLTIVLPGKYKVTDAIPVLSNTKVLGTGTVYDGRSAESYSEYSAVFYGENIENVLFENLTVEGTGAGNHIASKVLMYFHETENVTIHNCKFLNTNALWAILFNHCNRSIVDSCNINEYGYGGAGNLNEGDNFSVLNSTFINARTTGNNSYAIMLNGYDHDVAEKTYGGNGLSAVNNYCYNDNPTWEYIDAHGGTNVIVSLNKLDNAKCGIAIFGDASRNFDCKNVVIDGNVIDCNTDEIGTSGYALSVGGENVRVTNNIISNGGKSSDTTTQTAHASIYARAISDGYIGENILVNSYGIGIYGLTYTNVTIKNNKVSGVSKIASLEQYGMYFGNGIYDNVLVEENEMSDSNVGIYTPRAFTNANPYMKIQRNRVNNVNTLFSASNVAGLIPQQASSVSAFTIAKFLDFIANKNMSASSIGWIYNGSAWIELAGKQST